MMLSEDMKLSIRKASEENDKTNKIRKQIFFV